MNPNEKNKPKPAAARSARGDQDANPAGAAGRKSAHGKLFSVNATPADGNPGLPLAPRRPQRSWRLWALLCLAITGGVIAWLHAQDQPAPEPTVVPVPVPADDSAQSVAPGQMEDAAPADQNGPADDAVQTNGPGQFEMTGQTNSSGRRIRRSYRHRSGSMSGANYSAGGEIMRLFAARSTNAVPRPDFSTFNIIAQRNIFDPNRHPGIVRDPQVRTVRSEHITLVGVMSYEKGTFAFFDGDGSEYQKALQQAGTIAGYTVTDIRPDSVKLLAGTNGVVELKVGMQLRREEGGPWHVSAAPETYASTSPMAPRPAGNSNGTSADSVPSGPVSDILQRLMKQREQE